MRKIKGRFKLLVYACSAIGVNLLGAIMSSYLCSAILVGGFNPEQIPYHTFAGKDLVVAGVWAVFALIAKILDGVIDIPMASFTDNLRSKWGRRRPTILLGLSVLIASYPLFLLIPVNGESIWNTIYYGVILCIFYTSYTLTLVSYYATFTEIVETREERNFISNVKSVCDIFYFIIVYVLVAAMLKGLNIRPVALICLPAAFTMLIPLFMIKEESTLKADMEREKTVNLWTSLKYTFKNKDFIKWMIVYSFLTFGVQLFLGGINEYFSYTGMSMMFIMMACFAPVPFTLFIYNFLIKKKGFRFAFRYILAIFAISMTCLFGVSFLEAGTTKLILSIVGGFIGSFSIGALFSVAYSVPSQLAAEDEERTGISHSAMYFAVQGLFAGVAAGIATGVVLTALKATSVASEGMGFPHGSMTYLTLIGAAACMVAFVLMFFLPKSLDNIGRNKEEE